MLTYDMTQRGNKSLYEFLYEQIRNDILKGHLLKGTKLPSKRKLAEHLSVSIITVQNAYDLLLAEGYIGSEPRRGYFVAEAVSASFQVSYPTEAKPAVLSTYDVDLVGGSGDVTLMAYSVWAKIMRRVITQYGKSLLEAMEFQGVFRLRSAIAAYLTDFRGMKIDPVQIIVGAGTEYLYNLLIQLLGRDAVYGYEDPGYRKIQQIFTVNGVVSRAIPVDAKGMSYTALRESDVSVIHISPAHQFPTGITMPVGRRQALLGWAYEAQDRYILEDDYDSEFRFSGKPIRSLFEIDGNDRVIYLNTFSKTISPSLRISYMVLPKPLMEKFRRTMDFYACTVSSLEQYVLAEYIENGSFERHINRCRKLYRQKRDAVVEMIQKSVFSEHVSVDAEDAGLHFLLRIQSGHSEAELRSMCEACGIRISFISDYAVCREVPKCAVINYASVDLQKLEQAIRRLEIILKEKRSSDQN